MEGPAAVRPRPALLELAVQDRAQFGAGLAAAVAAGGGALPRRPVGAGGEAPSPPVDPKAENPLDRAVARDAGRALEAAILELREAYREILLLRFSEGLSYEEIAEVTGAPLGTVKVHLHRARAELARRLRARGWDPEELR